MPAGTVVSGGSLMRDVLLALVLVALLPRAGYAAPIAQDARGDYVREVEQWYGRVLAALPAFEHAVANAAVDPTAAEQWGDPGRRRQLAAEIAALQSAAPPRLQAHEQVFYRWVQPLSEALAALHSSLLAARHETALAALGRLRALMIGFSPSTMPTSDLTEADGEAVVQAYNLGWRLYSGLTPEEYLHAYWLLVLVELGAAVPAETDWTRLREAAQEVIATLGHRNVAEAGATPPAETRSPREAPLAGPISGLREERFALAYICAADGLPEIVDRALRLLRLVQPASLTSAAQGADAQLARAQLDALNAEWQRRYARLVAAQASSVEMRAERERLLDILAPLQLASQALAQARAVASATQAGGGRDAGGGAASLSGLQAQPYYALARNLVRLARDRLDTTPEVAQVPGCPERPPRRSPVGVDGE